LANHCCSDPGHHRVAFFNAFTLASNLAQTSDSAQGFVVGHAIANGNALLSGWHFPIDSFYFTDSVLYAAAEWTAGARPQLMAFVPALVYGLSCCWASSFASHPGSRPAEIWSLRRSSSCCWLRRHGLAPRIRR
jgi:hypothetical protein